MLYVDMIGAYKISFVCVRDIKSRRNSAIVLYGSVWLFLIGVLSRGVYVVGAHVFEVIIIYPIMLHSMQTSINISYYHVNKQP